MNKIQWNEIISESLESEAYEQLFNNQQTSIWLV